MAHLLHGKIEIDVGIKSPAEQFREVHCSRLHHVSNMAPAKIQGCKMHQGEWGSAGSIICWDYVHNGNAKVVKHIIEAIDHEKKSTTFRVIEGDLMKLYKYFSLIVSVTLEGEGSVVHWTLEYEKLRGDIPEPYCLLEFLVHVTKDMDNHLMSTAWLTS